MPLELALGYGTRLELTESPFVDDIVIAGVIENTRGDPGLNNQCRQTSAPEWIPRPKMERVPLKENEEKGCAPLYG